MSDSIPSLLSLLIGAGSLWLALDFARHRSVWFAALFALLALERLAGLLPLPGAFLQAGLLGALPAFGLRLALALVLGRLVVGRLFFLLARRYRLEIGDERR